MWSTQVDKTQILQVKAPSVLTGNKTIFPAQFSWGELVQRDKPQSMNIFNKANKHLSVREVTKVYLATHHDRIHDNKVRTTTDLDFAIHSLEGFHL